MHHNAGDIGSDAVERERERVCVCKFTSKNEDAVDARGVRLGVVVVVPDLSLTLLSS